MATADDIYNAIKAHELVFPIPIPSQTVHVGTFDAARGTFNGLTTDVESRSDMEGLRPPSRGGTGRPQPAFVKIPAVVHVNAIDVTLTFTSTTPGVEVTVNGTTVSAPGTTVSVDIGSALKATWSISSGGKSYHDVLEIDHSPIVGVGALTIPVLPVAIVYEPPPDATKKNQASYSISHAVSTTVKMSFGNGTTKSYDGDFLTLANVGALLTSIGTVLKNFSQATAKPGGGAGGGGAGNWFALAGSAIQLIVSLIGTTTDTTSTDVTTTQSHTLSLKNIVGDTITTGAQDGGNFGGPGTGDVFYVLRNARVMWVAQNGALHLTLLDAASEASIGVAALKSGGASIGLDAATASALLALDPFVAAPKATPPGNRFVHIKTCEVDQAAGRHDFSLTLTRDEDIGTAAVTTTVNTHQEREGWLGFLGVGPGANQTTKTTITNSQGTDTDTTDTTVATLSLFSNGTEPAYAVEVLADTVFGTFAFRSTPIASAPLAAGTALDAAGRPLAGVEVTLQSGGKTFATITNAKGQFRFRSTDIAPGNVSIHAGAVSHTALLGKTPLQNIVLKPGA